MKEKRKVPVRDTIKLLWAMDRKFPVIVILQGGLNALLFYLPVILVARILDLLVYREKFCRSGFYSSCWTGRNLAFERCKSASGKGDENQKLSDCHAF